MDKQPKVSVVVIFWNTEKFIAEAVESVLAQTYHDWELLLVDDGSSDGSSAIAKLYASRFPDRIRYLVHSGNRNLGKSASRNLGVKQARGEYIALLDADDVFLAEKLERQVNILDRNPSVALVYGPTLYWYGWTGRPEDIRQDWMAEVGVKPNDIYDPPQLMTLYLNRGETTPCTCAWMARKAALAPEGGSEDSFKNLYEDQVFLAKLVLNYPVYVQGDSLDKYRQHPHMSSNLAIQTGEYSITGPHQSQAVYYRWLSKYIVQRRIRDQDLKTALRKRLLPYEHPFFLWITRLCDLGITKLTKTKTWLVDFVCNTKCVSRLNNKKYRSIVSSTQDRSALAQSGQMLLRENLTETKGQDNRRGLILMYHRICQLAFDPRRLSVSPSHFEEHLHIIKKYGRPVQMQEMGKNLNRLSNGALEIAVTLDDGYTDNFRNAKPILERNNVPATFFIISGSINNREEFFWDGLERTILAPKRLPERFELIMKGKEYGWKITAEGPCELLDYSKAMEGIPSNGSVLTRSQLYTALIQLLSPLPMTERKEPLECIARWAGQDLTTRPDFLPMNADELRSLAHGSLFEIGAHTVNHPRLAALSVGMQEKEISCSKKELEDMINRPITSFSYPHGDYSEDTPKLVQRLKFDNACTVVEKPVVSGSDPFQLPRFAVCDWDGDQFEENLLRWLAQTS